MYQQISWLSGGGSMGTELCGYLASALVLVTFSMRSMRALRLTAIASNIAFIGYAAIADLHPVFALHCLLLPLNIFRLVQSELTAPGASVWVQKFRDAGTKKIAD